MFRNISYKLLYFCLIILQLAQFSSSFSSEIVRKTVYGYVKGNVLTSNANSSIEYISFKGIPYAKPPLGPLRFKEPLRPDTWSEIKETTKTAERCTQLQFDFVYQPIGTEDCLYLNVYIPKTSHQPKTSKLPVMVWIHGGNFAFSLSNVTEPDYFMEKPVVIVELQYRLNVFGFLSTQDENAKGNLGLKDQNLALQWVRENIANFDGDPTRVTIFGGSAGAAATLYHVLSDKSRGLFSKAIGQSGSSLCRWSVRKNPEEMVRLLANGLGIEYDSNKELVEKLQLVDQDVLIIAALNISVVGPYLPYHEQPFAPIIETYSDTAFISESSFEKLQNGDFAKLPYMTGVNTEEGGFPYFCVITGLVNIDSYQENPEMVIPASMNILPGTKCAKDVLESVTEQYFPDRNYTNKYNWIPYMSQELFVRGIMKTIELMYRDLPLYFYKFSYPGNNKSGFIGGVTHGGELQYMWYSNNNEENEDDRIIRKRVVTMWTNFATTGNPTPEYDDLLENQMWPRFTDEQKYIEIGRNLTVSVRPFYEDVIFWKKQFENCGTPPFITY